MSWRADLVERWWIRLPVAVAVRAPATGNALTDGLHLTRWPAVGGLAPPVAVLIGIGVGAATDVSVTSDLLLMSVLMLVGIQSVCLGAFAWLGFVVSDMLSGAPLRYSLTIVERWVGVPLSTLSHWLLVAAITIVLPMTVLAFRIELRRTPWPERLGEVGERVAVVTFAVALSWLWVTALPLLVRPIFRLVGDDPAAEAIVGVQERWWILVLVAVAGWAGRMGVERRALGAPYYATLRTLATRLAEIPPRVTVPRLAARVWTTIGLTLLLAGLIESWWWVPLVLAAVYAILAGRDRMSSVAALTTIPLLYRSLGATIMAFVLLRVTLSAIATGGRLTQDSFAVPLVATLMAMAAVALLTAPARTAAPAPEAT